jgi:hypothetical protein
MKINILYFFLFLFIITACSEKSSDNSSPGQSTEQITSIESARGVSADIYTIVDSFLPQGTADESINDETKNGVVNGYAIYSGNYTYVFSSPDVTQNWNSFAITFYSYSNDANLTIVSGQLEANGSHTSTPYSDSLTITGNIVITGVYNNVDIKDSINLNLTYSLIAPPENFTSGSTLTNSIQTFDVSGELVK